MMKFSKRLSIIFTVILFIVTMFSGILNAYADTTKYSDIYFDSSTPGGSQHQFITITKDYQWTPYKYVAGQPEKGTYLKKGDALFYSESNGNTCSISVSVGFGCGSVGLSIPMGKMAQTGTSLVASKNGYYKIKVKKQVQPIIMLIRRRANGTSKWGSPSVYKKKYKVIRVYPVLQEIK